LQECKKYDRNKGIHREERKYEKGHKMGFMALWLYGFMALWLYGFMWTLQKYFYCIETANYSNFPKKEKLLCSNKFCREKLFIHNCEWKFIVNSGLMLFSRSIYFGEKQKSAKTARSSIGQGESLELCK